VNVSIVSPRSLEPMLATLGPLPVRGGWSFEPKGDGFRALCFLERGRVSLVSRRGNDLTRLCPGVSVLTGADIALAFADDRCAPRQDFVPNLQRDAEK
jgi:ATP-dependent DNA ligase